MSVDGKWDVVVNSPMGAQKLSIDFKPDGAALLGTATGPDGDRDIADGTINGDDMFWKLDISTPVPVTLEFSGTAEDGKLSGSVKAGMFGSFTFTGERA